MAFNGIVNGLGDLSRLSDAKTRSISSENLTGEKGRGGMCKWEDGAAKEASRDLGLGWKVNPYTNIEPGETFVMADIDGPGCIQHIWLTPAGYWRHMILRIYWDGSEIPSVECPVGDFFACGIQGDFAQVNSLPVCVNPGSAFNCYWNMPFRKKCKVTMENISDEKVVLYYQIDYTLTDISEDCAYFHAQFRRVNPLPYKEVYTILDNVKGKGHFVGTYMTWGVNNTGWWGEGELKVYLDNDGEYPTICGTGTEDYFCGSYNFDVGGQYREFSTPYAGMPKVVRPNGTYSSQQRFSLYRWHITDPIRFEENIKITMQALGWRKGGRYLPLQDDISSVAFWYQTLPGAPLYPLLDKDGLEMI